MSVPTNITDAAALNASFDKEFVKNFTGESDRLAEILGIFRPEIKPAGTALKMLKVTGSLVNTKTDATKAEATGAITLGHSSGSAYVEGDEVSLSKFSASLGSGFESRRAHQTFSRSGSMLDLFCFL